MSNHQSQLGARSVGRQQRGPSRFEMRALYIWSANA